MSDSVFNVCFIGFLVLCFVSYVIKEDGASRIVTRGVIIIGVVIFVYVKMYQAPELPVKDFTNWVVLGIINKIRTLKELIWGVFA